MLTPTAEIMVTPTKPKPIHIPPELPHQKSKSKQIAKAIKQKCRELQQQQQQLIVLQAKQMPSSTEIIETYNLCRQLHETSAELDFIEEIPEDLQELVTKTLSANATRLESYSQKLKVQFDKFCQQGVTDAVIEIYQANQTVLDATSVLVQTHLR